MAWLQLRSLENAAISVQKADQATCVEVYWSGMAQLYRDAHLCGVFWCGLSL